MNCVHGVRLDKDCMFCINGTEPKTTIPDNRNDLLRSAYQIACRNGENTNWEAFKTNLERELMNQVGYLDSEDPQDTIRATCTPLTYHFISEEISKETRELARAITEQPNLVKNAHAVEKWARKLADDISKGKD